MIRTILFLASWLLLTASAVGGDAAAGAPGRVDRPPPLVGGRANSRSVVLVLHGGSYGPRPALELAQRALDALDGEARRLGLRLLVPVAPEALLQWGRETGAASPWGTPAGRQLALAVLDADIEAGRCNPQRVTLAGHGAGATASVALAAAHPERFVAVALWSGTPEPLWEWPGPPPSPTRRASETGAAAEASRSRARRTRNPRSGTPPAPDESPRVVGLADDPVPALGLVPVYLWTGDEDAVLDRRALQLFVEQMGEQAARGGGHVLCWEHGRGGHDHGPGPRRGLAFLMAQARTQRP